MKQIHIEGHRLLLLLIMTVATVLRFYDFFNIPFTYDEVSAWSRTGYESFSTLIENGVRPDGHPAGVQVFLNYWIKWFGDREWIVKLPFLLMGLASVWLTYLIGKRWFGENPGLLAAVYLGTLQYTVMFSQIARPYASGVFFVLVTVWWWSRFLFDGKRAAIIGFVAASTLCCYNHYFSMLVAMIMGLTGLFFVKRRDLVVYLLSGLSVVILFLPHVFITIHQLGIGGVAWLQKPQPSFVTAYLRYVFDYSNLVLVLVAAIFLAGLVSRLIIRSPTTTKTPFRNLRMVLFLWFALPLGIGFFYSVYRTPVLQFPVLIFSFPFLILLLTSFVPDLPTRVTAFLVCLILAVNTYALVAERKHYALFYDQQVETLVKNSIQVTEDFKTKTTLTFLNESEKYSGYYLRKYNAAPTIRYWQDEPMTQNEFRNFLNNTDAGFICAENMPFDYVALIRERFPFLVREDKGFTYSFYCFSKHDTKQTIPFNIVYTDSLNLQLRNPRWQYSKTFISENQPTQIHFTRDDEFGLTYTVPYYSFIKHRYNHLLVTADFTNLPVNPDIKMVLSVTSGNEQHCYYEQSVSNFATDSAARVYFTYNMRDMEEPSDSAMLKIYIRNNGRHEFDIMGMKVELEEGNPWIYSMIEPLTPEARANASNRKRGFGMERSKDNQPPGR